MTLLVTFTIFVVILLKENGEGTREDGKACCHVTFLGRNLIKNAPLPVAGRDAEVQEFLENSLDVSVRCKSERGFGVANFSFSDEIIKHQEFIDVESIKPSRKRKRNATKRRRS